jgi:hypothetical protein
MAATNSAEDPAKAPKGLANPIFSACWSALVLFWCGVVLRVNSNSLNQLNEDQWMVDNWTTSWVALVTAASLVIIHDIFARDSSPSWARLPSLAMLAACKPPRTPTGAVDRKAMVIIAAVKAIGEEALFRGGILAAVPGWLGPPPVPEVLGMLLSAVCSQAYHGSEAFAFLAGLDAVLLCLACRAGGLASALMAHFMFKLSLSILCVLGEARATAQDRALPQAARAKAKAKAGRSK